MSSSRPGLGQEVLLRVGDDAAPTQCVVDDAHGDRVTLRATGDVAALATNRATPAQLQYVDRFGVYDADVTVVQHDDEHIVVALAESADGVRRRVYARLRAPIDAACLLLDATHNVFTPLDASVVDIGGGGAAIAVPAIAPTGATIVCSIALPDGAPVVTVGTVLAPDADPRDHPDRRHVRLQFTLITEADRDRLLGFILRSLRTANAS